MKSKLIITSTNPNLSHDEIEEELVKAVESRRLKREDKKELRDLYLKNHKDRTAHAVHLVFQSMMSEIEKVLK